MPPAKLTYDDVRQLALALPDVEEATAYGSPAFKVRGAIMAGKPANKSAEPGSLGIIIDFDQRDALIAEAPETYYITDHYKNYPSVLVRLSQIGEDQLRDLLTAAHRYVSSKKKRPARGTAKGTAMRKHADKRTS